MILMGHATKLFKIRKFQAANKGSGIKCSHGNKLFEAKGHIKTSKAPKCFHEMKQFNNKNKRAVE